MQILAGLSMSKKRERTPRRASPMSLVMVSRIISFLQSDEMFNETMRVWFSAVCSLNFYGMCMINEVLLMKKADVRLGLRRKSRMSDIEIRFGCFTTRDRKTDHDQEAEALTYVTPWFAYVSFNLHHSWHDDDYVFLSLTKIPRGGSEKRKRTSTSGVSFANVGVKWGAPMSDSNFTQIITIVAEAAGISRNLLGDEIRFTSHFSRRGDAQYRFMFTPENRRWSLKFVKWWVGWAPTEKTETVTRYLFDDVLNREENQLGDSLAPDVISCSNAIHDSIADIDYGCLEIDDDASKCRVGSTNADTTATTTDITNRVVQELKELVEGLLNTVKGICGSVRVSAEAEVESTDGRTVDTTTMVSEIRMLALGVSTSESTSDSIDILTLRATSIAQG
ncbi:hypothetical protein PHMEG_00018286 [Phytophthora megakarya]|uniref:Uncharacterized protein n=1 Tax=Phytophthora megakarya TaxID=4795 RepID=A0A225VUQ1_9STRA|nr:hypothetical protein PHMEG_00018286 [Phytophthora megakarya]